MHPPVSLEVGVCNSAEGAALMPSQRAWVCKVRNEKSTADYLRTLS